nr:MAG TPA: hypothetical protein [Caudoviricetes sp.]
MTAKSGEPERLAGNGLPTLRLKRRSLTSWNCC